jgi:hypothetical protein
MKIKKFEKKLGLNKKTISNLTISQAGIVKGGFGQPTQPTNCQTLCELLPCEITVYTCETCNTCTCTCITCHTFCGQDTCACAHGWPPEP